MSMKKSDIEKNKGLKITGAMKATAVPERFAQGSNTVLSKRERRDRDAAAGLVPFACKLPADLQKRLHERAATHDGGINALVAELLKKGLT
jgi:hypothetical protein